MNRKTYSGKWFCCICFSLLIVLSSCGGASDARRSDGGTMSNTSSRDVSQVKPLPGKKFNKYFPKGEGEYKVNFSQEKRGTAQAKLKNSDKEVAVLTVTDLASNPERLKKYANATTNLGQYPMRKVGSMGTAILVGNRFQVQVRSKDQSFTASDRENWLKKFNLKSIANLNTK